MKFKPSNINLLEWVSIVPKIVALVQDAIEALRDRRLDEAEVKALGAALVAILAAVA